MLIDKTNPEFSDVPESLNGEVLLERTVDAKGRPTGFLTASVEAVRALKGKTDAELSAMGWLKYKPIIETLP
jgi:hypothetical protein